MTSLLPGTVGGWHARAVLTLDSGLPSCGSLAASQSPVPGAMALALLGLAPHMFFASLRLGCWAPP